MDLQMTGMKAIVTGASAGIGKAVTRSLAREGVDVAICARRKGPLEEAAAEIAKETGRKIVPIVADLTKPADAENFVKQAHAGLGRIDIRVNNGGAPRGGATEQNVAILAGEPQQRRFCPESSRECDARF